MKVTCCHQTGAIWLTWNSLYMKKQKILSSFFLIANCQNKVLVLLQIVLTILWDWGRGIFIPLFQYSLWIQDFFLYSMCFNQLLVVTIIFQCSMYFGHYPIGLTVFLLTDWTIKHNLILFIFSLNSGINYSSLRAQYF